MKLRIAPFVICAIVLFFSTRSFANPCNVAVSVSPQGTFQIASGGGSSLFFVNTGGNNAGTSCHWSANNSSFISVSPGGGGGGTQFQFTVNFTVFANPDLAQRNGSIVITQTEDGTQAVVPISQNAATGDFQLSATPSPQTVAKDSSSAFTIAIVRSGSFSGSVCLSAAGLPAGVSASFSPACTTGSSSTMTVTASPTAATGNFSLTINGQNAGVVTRSTIATLIIQPVCAGEACAKMGQDGSFTTFGPGGNTLWTTGPTTGQIFRVQDDGNIVTYQEVWQAGTYVTPSPGPFPTQTCPIATLLHAPQFLTAGQCIISPNGQYFLYMASDGNFFIYNIAIGSGTWGPGTYGHPGAFADLQTDGNFVVYDSASRPLWSSGTSGSGADLLNMENDGRIILYKPVWQSGTSQGWSSISLIHPACDVGPGTGLTGVIGAGQCFVSPDGRYELLLQTSGTLVLQDNSVNPPAILWQRP